jgi:hypothetical protein
MAGFACVVLLVWFCLCGFDFVEFDYVGPGL